MTSLGFWLKLGDGGVREGFRSPTLLFGLFSTAKKGFKLIENYLKPYNRAQVSRGAGISGGSAKSPSLSSFFLKPFLISTLGPTWNSTLLEFLQVILASWATKWHDYPKEPPTHPTEALKTKEKV